MQHGQLVLNYRYLILALCTRHRNFCNMFSVLEDPWIGLNTVQELLEADRQVTKY